MEQAGGAGNNQLARSGQLSYAQFAGAMRELCAWWRDSHPRQPAWVVQSKRLPVVDQVVAYVQLERAVTVPREQLHQHAGARSSTAAAAAEDGLDERAPPHVAGCPPPSPDEAAWLGSGGAAAAADECQLAAAVESALRTEPEQRGQQAHSAATAAGAAVHLHHYSIVWHESFRVPVLYLRGCLADGKPLSLPELLAGLPQLLSYQEPGAASWTFLTATEHPVTRAPSFMLHPCQTAARMQLMLQQSAEGARQGEPEEQGLLRYAVAWLSLVAPLLGLPVLRLSG